MRAERWPAAWIIAQSNLPQSMMAIWLSYQVLPNASARASARVEGTSCSSKLLYAVEAANSAMCSVGLGPGGVSAMLLRTVTPPGSN